MSELPPPTLRHMALFLTESCNLACPYCFASNMERRAIDEGLARQAIDLLLTPESKARSVAVSFWGGEPLLCFDLLAQLVEYAEKRAVAQEREIQFSVPTNLTLLDDRMIDFFQEHKIGLSLSLDGDASAQGRRTFAGGRSTVPVINEKIELMKRRYGDRLPAVRMTVSPETAGEFFHHVSFFLDHGFKQVYFAPVVEAPWSAEELAVWEAEQERLVDFWAEQLTTGKRVSFNTWDKALAWREFKRVGQADPGKRFLCGAGSTMLAMDIYGDLYPCHRFVFYDKANRAEALGHVSQGLPDPARLVRYAEVDGDVLGTAERRCADCEDVDQCFVYCPALNYALGGDILVIDERLCAFARQEQRMVDRLTARIGDHPRFERYVKDFLLKVYAPGALSASVAAVFAGLGEEDVERLADRAAEILGRLHGPESAGQ